ncbi:MAG: hypothetical protein JWO36_7131 [Myxococcales bacterium]|nr:hypothetical protein [Myxococcales bacterium]
MYRDTATDLDEHDRAVGAILIGEALIDECERAATRSRQTETVPAAERWRAMTEVHDTYPEIWRHLDRAQHVLASRGANTMAYDEMRPLRRRAATQDGPDGSQSIDNAALEDAKRAMAELKLAVPGADWDAIDARTEGLVRAPLSFHKRQRLVMVSVVTLFVLAVITWAAAIVPSQRPDRNAEMRHELQDIAQQRKQRIETLQAQVGTRCDPVQVHELVKLLVLDGRGPDAAEFGDSYIDRCGEDMVVEHWANAPRPGH